MTRSDTRGILYTTPPGTETTTADDETVDEAEHAETAVVVDHDNSSQAAPADD